MATAGYTYTNPASPPSLTGLVCNDPVYFSIGLSQVSGTFTPMQIDPGNPTGPSIPVPGSLPVPFTIPLTQGDLESILNVIFGRANALGLVPLAGTAYVTE